MKQLNSIILVGLLLLVVLMAGCIGTSTSTEDIITVTIQTSTTSSTLKPTIASTTTLTATTTQAPTTTSIIATTTTTILSEAYSPDINPADFTAKIDNKYYPLIPGTKFVLKGSKDGAMQVNEAIATNKTKVILGVTTVVVNDKVTDKKGALIEMTFDWYAQDKDGNVWYFGEDSKEYQQGKVVSTEGSWEAGVDGAKPGIIMKANPQAGDTWRQEYYKGNAEDMAEVLSVNENVTISAGTFTNCVKTKDWTPLEPEIVENKYYCPNAGVVKAIMVEGGSEQMELIRITAE